MSKEIEKITHAADVLLNPAFKAGNVRTLLKKVTNDFGFFNSDVDTKSFLADLAKVIDHEKEAIARNRSGERQRMHRRNQRKPDGNVTYIAAKPRSSPPLKGNGAAPDDGPIAG